MPRICLILALVLMELHAGPTTRAADLPDSIAILPERIELRGPEDRHVPLVLLREGEQVVGPAADVTWSTSDAAVAEVADGEVVPRGDGRAMLTARAGGHETRVEVVVRDFQAPVVWSFRHDVEPVLARAGCNSGACHGALAGKGGFRLTLRGYDPTTDHFTITRQARGRRINLADPGRSLLLAKPAGALPHKGGVRLEVGSPGYHALSQWIASGAPGPADDDSHVERIEALPRASRLEVGVRQPLLVLAHYSDGRVRDVTRLAKFASADESVARVDEQGNVEVIGHGEGAVTAWFASQIVIARVTSPYAAPRSDTTLAGDPPRNFIDEHVLTKLCQLGLPASPRADDAEFVRRVFLDTIGTLPTADEVRAFLADSAPDKRDRLIDSLLARPEFVDY